jgi:hypothetical protein
MRPPPAGDKMQSFIRILIRRIFVEFFYDLQLKDCSLSLPIAIGTGKYFDYCKETNGGWIKSRIELLKYKSLPAGRQVRRNEILIVVMQPGT